MTITLEALDKRGFTKWNEHFTYRCFPAPLYGYYRIDKDKDTGNWYISVTNGETETVLANPKTMYDVAVWFQEKTGCNLP